MTMRDDLTALAEEMIARVRWEATLLRAILNSHPEPPAPPVAQAMPTRRELADVFMRAHMAWRSEHGDLYLQVADQVLALLAAQESAAPVVSEIQRRWGIEGDESDVGVCERLGTECSKAMHGLSARGRELSAAQVEIDALRADLARVTSERDTLRADRDEWRQQHENAVACWKCDINAMRDELAKLRRGMEEACYAYEISNTDGPLDDVMESWIKRLGLFSKPASGHDLDLPPRAGWDANGSPVDAEGGSMR